jgi:hypothetical protein
MAKKPNNIKQNASQPTRAGAAQDRLPMVGEPF